MILILERSAMRKNAVDRGIVMMEIVVLFRGMGNALISFALNGSEALERRIGIKYPERELLFCDTRRALA
jgi:hypothetical protein